MFSQGARVSARFPKGFAHPSIRVEVSGSTETTRGPTTTWRLPLGPRNALRESLGVSTSAGRRCTSASCPAPVAVEDGSVVPGLVAPQPGVHAGEVVGLLIPEHLQE